MAGGPGGKLATVVLASMLVVVPVVPAAAGGAERSSEDPWLGSKLQQAIEKRPGEPVTVLVGLDRVPDDAVRQALHDEQVPSIAFEHVPVVAATLPAGEVDRLQDLPGALSIVLDRNLERMTDEGSPLSALPDDLPVLPSGEQSNFGGTGDELVRADRARELGVNGSDVGLAVIDLGTSGLHPGLRPDELGGPLVQNVKVAVGRDRLIRGQPATSPENIYLENQTNSDWTDGHGTHTAGIAAGQWTADGQLGGRAPGADLVALGTGDALALLWTVAAWDWVIGHQGDYDIRVVSNSYGLQGPYEPQHPINLATKAASEQGMLVVFSAGNNGPERRSLNMLAQAPHVLAVGSTTLAGSVYISSSRGDPQVGKPGPDVVAPGANIVSGRNQPVSANEVTLRTLWMDAGFVDPEHLYWYRAITGTSMAAPQVAGIATLVLDANPTLDADDVESILEDTARPVPGFDRIAQGAGLVDAEAAVRTALGEDVDAPDPVEPTYRSWEENEISYPFHGTMLASPAKGFAAFHHRLPFPVHLGALSTNLTFDWRTTPTGQPADGLTLTLTDPVGTVVEKIPLDGQGRAGTVSMDLSETQVTEHRSPTWSAAYWTLAVDMDSGAIEYDLDASVEYPTDELPPVERTEPPPPDPLRDLEDHDPILIETDADFTEENGVRRGSGTPSDPYVIEGWDIQAPQGDAVQIGSVQGTQAHVVLQNVRLHDAGGDCLELQRAQHVTVRSARFDGCDWATNVRGGSDLTFENNRFLASDRGISSYGSTGISIVNNTFEYMGTTAILLSQGLTQFGTASLDARVEANTLLGEDSLLALETAGTHGVEVEENRLGDGAAIRLSSGTSGNVVQGTEWLDGSPHYRWRTGITPHGPTGLNTIVDAGSDRTIPADGRVCFDDARAALDPTLREVRVTWTFGDGQVETGPTQACHDYDPMGGPYTARLSVVVDEPTGERRILEDAVSVG